MGFPEEPSWVVRSELGGAGKVAWARFGRSRLFEFELGGGVQHGFGWRFSSDFVEFPRRIWNDTRS